jgi:hypothetical protein
MATIKAKVVGSLLGYTIRKTAKTYIFGCGDVKLPVSVVENFVKELEKRKAKKSLTQAEKDFNRIEELLERRGIPMKKLNHYDLRHELGMPLEDKKVPKKAAKKK